MLTPLTNAAVYYLIFGVVLGTNRNMPKLHRLPLHRPVRIQLHPDGGQFRCPGDHLNLGLIRALHFPRACLPIAITLTQFQQLLASIVVLMGIVLVTGEPLTVEWLLIVPALLLQSVFNAGLAMAMARPARRSPT